MGVDLAVGAAVATHDGLHVQTQVHDGLVELDGQPSAPGVRRGHHRGGVPQVRLEDGPRPAQVDDQHAVGVVAADVMDREGSAVRHGQHELVGDALHHDLDRLRLESVRIHRVRAPEHLREEGHRRLAHDHGDVALGRELPNPADVVVVEVRADHLPQRLARERRLDLRECRVGVLVVQGRLDRDQVVRHLDHEGVVARAENDLHALRQIHRCGGDGGDLQVEVEPDPGLDIGHDPLGAVWAMALLSLSCQAAATRSPTSGIEPGVLSGRWWPLSSLSHWCARRASRSRAR